MVTCMHSTRSREKKRCMLMFDTKPVFSSPLNFQKVLQYPSHRILRYVHGTLNVDGKKKLIAQFGRKLRDEHFEPN